LPQLRDEFLADLMTNHTFASAVIRENFAKYQIQLEEKNLIMLAVIFDATQMALKNEKHHLLLTDINAAIDSASHPISFFYSSNLSVTLLNAPASPLQNLNGQICAAIINTVKSRVSLNSRILVSVSFDGYQMIPAVFQGLFAKVPYCFYSPKDSYRYMAQFQNTTDHITLDFRNLNTLADRFNFNELRSTVKNWVEDQISQAKYIDPYILKKFFSEVCYLVIYKCVEMGFYWEEVNEKKFEALKKIENSMDYESLMQAFTAILTDLEQFFTGHIQIKCNTVITAVIKYIHQNYDQEISLESTAKHFFIDKSYLCKLFKKHINQNFNDYLLQIRINKAKELLIHPEYTVNRVAPMVGYSDYSYFGRVFKKKVGMTPSEFKKSLLPVKKH
jgi:two-component system response regulator YesN